MYRQFQLRSDDHRLTCWLKCDGTDGQRVRVGSLITLRHDPDRWWEVTWRGDHVETLPPLKFWKVGGLV